MPRTVSGLAGESFDLVLGDHLFDHRCDCLATLLVFLDQWSSDVHHHFVDKCEREWTIVDATAEWRKLLEDWNVAVEYEHDLVVLCHECLANIEIEIGDLLLGQTCIVGEVDVCSGNCV